MNDGGFLVFQLIIICITGGIAAAIASSKGRTPVGWFFCGFLLGLIGIIIIAVMPNLKTEKAKEERIERENRRLREQLRQEQIKGESFRQHTATRLDAHDGHLGVDTRNTLPDSQPAHGQLESFGPASGGSASLESTSGAIAETSAGAAGGAQRSSRQWHYETEGETHGPIDEAQLMSMVRSGAIRANTLLWTEELGDWKAADSIKALRDHLQA